MSAIELIGCDGASGLGQMRSKLSSSNSRRVLHVTILNKWKVMLPPPHRFGILRDRTLWAADTKSQNARCPIVFSHTRCVVPRCALLVSPPPIVAPLAIYKLSVKFLHAPMIRECTLSDKTRTSHNKTHAIEHNLWLHIFLLPVLACTHGEGSPSDRCHIRPSSRNYKRPAKTFIYALRMHTGCMRVTRRQNRRPDKSQVKTIPAHRTYVSCICIFAFVVCSGWQNRKRFNSFSSCFYFVLSFICFLVFLLLFCVAIRSHHQRQRLPRTLFVTQQSNVLFAFPFATPYQAGSE